jgi:hypothetical protein
MHAGHTNQTTSTQTLLPPNALTLSPIKPPNVYTYTQSPASFNTHLFTVLTSHLQKEKSAAKKHEISSEHSKKHEISQNYLTRKVSSKKTREHKII